MMAPYLTASVAIITLEFIAFSERLLLLDATLYQHPVQRILETITSRYQLLFLVSSSFEFPNNKNTNKYIKVSNSGYTKHFIIIN